jgi:general nucleoside transport system ATP-binding protein
MVTRTPLLEMIGISKAFPGAFANRDVHLSVESGTVHAIIGENGAGKSTLMNILYGRYRPDSGKILLDGREVSIDTPEDAIRLGIGMVTQHTTLIPALTLLENIILGAEPTIKGVIRTREAEELVGKLASRMEIELDLRAPAGRTSVATQQKAEIVKALYRDARWLILDEPTAALAPQESDRLFTVVRALVENGTTVLLITHKLREVMAHAESVTVMRTGRSIARRKTSETDADELLRLMIGSRDAALVPPGEREGRPLPIHRPESKPVLELRGLTVRGRGTKPAVQDLTLCIRSREIVGLAGFDGAGQREVAEAIAGLRPVRSGTILLEGRDITGHSTARRLSHGLAYIPEDRQRDGLIADFTIAENLLLGSQRSPLGGGGRFLNPSWMEEIGRETIRSAKILAAAPDVKVGTLSGGNQQKILLARALRNQPRLLVAVQPTRGLDVQSTLAVHDQIREAAARGAGILYISLDLEELLEVSDRIAVMFNGTLAGVVERAEASVDSMGRMMLGGTA